MFFLRIRHSDTAVCLLKSKFPASFVSLLRVLKETGSFILTRSLLCVCDSFPTSRRYARSTSFSVITISRYFRFETNSDQFLPAELKFFSKTVVQSVTEGEKGKRERERNRATGKLTSDLPLDTQFATLLGSRFKASL